MEQNEIEQNGIEQNVNSSSRPSDLKITDVRIANLAGIPMRVTLIRIDTNQGISGYGEVRDGASKTYALLLKSRLVGENPCNIDKLFRKIKQFGGHGRLAGGVCGVAVAACRDPAGGVAGCHAGHGGVGVLRGAAAAGVVRRRRVVGRRLGGVVTHRPRIRSRIRIPIRS